MDLAQVIVLALIQGILEFLPVSSSGHLILVPALLGWEDQGLGFDIAVHLGTLVAVVGYFRHDLVEMAASFFSPRCLEAGLTWAIIWGTVPLIVAGWLMAEQIAGVFRSPVIVAGATGIFGLLLWAADHFTDGKRSERAVSWHRAVLIGLGQALALVPGVSRSGITMTVAMALGLSREGAARFSFLLSIPALSLAAGWQLLQFAKDPEPVFWGILALAVVVSAATAFLTITLFIGLIRRMSMWIFALYRLILAGVIFYIFL